jgi:hypothetical protein
MVELFIPAGTEYQEVGNSKVYKTIADVYVDAEPSGLASYEYEIGMSRKSRIRVNAGDVRVVGESRCDDWEDAETE